LREFDQRAPHGVYQVMFDEQVPEAVGSLVEIRHAEIRGTLRQSAGRRRQMEAWEKRRS